ncbi:MAG: hypothetical protein ABI876_02870 [Bacteroidota bacterium]
MKQTVSQQAVALVEKKLAGLEGQLTPQDAATATGITVSEARDALSRLMELYVTRVSADDQGNVLFKFELPLRARGTKTAAERWAAQKDALWKNFKRLFRMWIGAMVLIYAVVMLLAVLAVLVAQSQGNSRDNRRRSNGGDLMSVVLRVLAEGLRFAFWTNVMLPTSYSVDEYGYRYRRVETPRGPDKNKKSFIIAIYDLALGPERAEPDPLATEQEVAAFLRAERGVLAPVELIGLSGGGIAEAEERMADYLVRFNGDPTITDEGVVLGEFDSFVAGKDAKADVKVTPYWDEYEPPYEHSGNPTERNVAIVGIVGFTFVSGIALLAGGLDTLRSFGPFFRTGFVHFLLGYMPILFSLSYFAISLIRYGITKKKEEERVARNKEKKVLKMIFQHRIWSGTADQIYFTIVSHGKNDIKREEIDPILQKLVVKLQGDIELGPEGEAIYTFDRLRREIEAAEQLRATRGGTYL